MFVVRFAILWHILNNFSQWFVLRKTPTKSFVCLFTVKSCNPYYNAIVSVSIVSSFVDYSRKQQNSETQKKSWYKTFAPPPHPLVPPSPLGTIRFTNINLEVVRINSKSSDISTVESKEMMNMGITEQLRTLRPTSQVSKTSHSWS